MAIMLKTTSAVSPAFVKVLVYGASGAGKTTLIPSLPAPVVLSAEAGLLSIRGADVPYIEIATMEDLREAYMWLCDSDEAKQFQSVAIDSLSEIAEVVLSSEKKIAKDPRQAYGAMQDQMGELIRAFRDLPNRHVYMSAKVERSQDEQGRLLYAPSMPGNKTGQALPYFFDEVLALRCEPDADGKPQRALMTDSDGVWLAKDRSSKLDIYEPADLGAVIREDTGMKSLAERWLEAKEAERVAVDARRELENEMIELLAIPETLEGTRTADVGGYTVKIVGRMNRKIDADALQEIARESGLSEYLSTLFRWKPDIIAGAWKSADKTITDALSGAITTEPGDLASVSNIRRP